MIKRSKSQKRRQPVRRKSSNQKRKRTRVFFGVIFLLLFLGITRIWMGNMHERTASRVLKLEKAHRTLMAESGILRAKLSRQSQFTRIEDLAHRKLNMIAPHVPPDTIWCLEPQPGVMMSSLTFSDLRFGD